MVDVFGEVDEQLRADRLRTLMQRAVPVFVAALVLSVLAVLAVWGVQKYSQARADKASLAYADAMDTLNKGDGAKAYDQFGDVARQGGTYGAMALMQQAGVRMDESKFAEAAALFDKAAAATKSPILSDLAVLKSAYATLDTAAPDRIEAKLAPLVKADRPYHNQAREAVAMAKLAAGKMADAKADLVALSLGSDTPDSTRQRAQAIIAMIDSGTAKSLKSLEQQAKTATPIPIPAPQPAAGPEGGPPQDPTAQGQPDAAQ